MNFHQNLTQETCAGFLS